MTHGKISTQVIHSGQGPSESIKIGLEKREALKCLSREAEAAQVETYQKTTADEDSLLSQKTVPATAIQGSLLTNLCSKARDLALHISSLLLPSPHGDAVRAVHPQLQNLPDAGHLEQKLDSYYQVPEKWQPLYHQIKEILTEQGEIVINTRDFMIEEIVNSGVYKSRTLIDKEMRQDARESIREQIELGLGVYDDFPVYGGFAVPPKGVTIYGNIVMKLHTDRVANRVTFTPGDTFNYGVFEEKGGHTRLLYPDYDGYQRERFSLEQVADITARKFIKEREAGGALQEQYMDSELEKELSDFLGVRYVEAQIFGGIRLPDIEEIRGPSIAIETLKHKYGRKLKQVKLVPCES